MADEFFIEKRPDKGDYAIRKPGSDRARGTAPTQEAAIEAAKEMNSNATIFAERQRHGTREPAFRNALAHTFAPSRYRG